MITFFRRLGAHFGTRDLHRLLLLLAVSALLLWLDRWLPGATGEAYLSPLLSSSAVVLALAAVSHLTRRAFFPDLDLQSIALRAVRDDSMPAAVVFAAITGLLGLLLYLNVGMLR